jgi:hypothetical protein
MRQRWPSKCRSESATMRASSGRLSRQRPWDESRKISRRRLNVFWKSARSISGRVLAMTDQCAPAVSQPRLCNHSCFSRSQSSRTSCGIESCVRNVWKPGGSAGRVGLGTKGLPADARRAIIKQSLTSDVLPAGLARPGSRLCHDET